MGTVEVFDCYNIRLTPIGFIGVSDRVGRTSMAQPDTTASAEALDPDGAEPGARVPLRCRDLNVR